MPDEPMYLEQPVKHVTIRTCLECDSDCDLGDYEGTERAYIQHRCPQCGTPWGSIICREHGERAKPNGNPGEFTCPRDHMLVKVLP